MLVELNHSEVRNLAKAIRERVGRDVKHSAIIEVIAKAVGLNADAMMHALKNSTDARLKLDGKAIEALADNLSGISKAKVDVSDVMTDIGQGDLDAPIYVVFTFRWKDGELRMFSGNEPPEPVELHYEDAQLGPLSELIRDSRANVDRTIFEGMLYRVEVLAVPVAKAGGVHYSDPLQGKVIEALSKAFAPSGRLYVPVAANRP
ncbi:hypothetical protein [Rhizobium sp. BK176]|uniref:hypothetical protein n=1 Tax=Rhizobium sp. BK176 TaxID=2587071 RepID=UPI00216A34FD|nr:hypothetical protein [Rhizobium sp. BK176]MCS4088446.1 hypothetical protein [Rhizobium sp. BK176]